MSLADRIDLPDRVEYGLARALQAFLLGVAAFGVVRVDPGMVLTGAIPLAISLVPGLVRRDLGVPLDWGWSLWVAVAVALHVVGTLWAYHRIGWFDDLAHFVSGSLVAVSGYVLTMTLARHAEGVDLPDRYRWVYVLVVVLAMGVAWEGFEHGAEVVARLAGMQAPLVQYGSADVAKDLLFDSLGGVVVAVWVVPSVREVPRALARRLW